MKPEDFLDNYKDALATQKWEAVSPLIHKDACVVFSSGTHKGKAEVKKAFERNFALIKNDSYSMSNIHWVQKTEDYSVYLFSFHWTGIINEKPAEDKGRDTGILIKENGNWQLLAEHLGH